VESRACSVPFVTKARSWRSVTGFLVVTARMARSVAVAVAGERWRLVTSSLELGDERQGLWLDPAQPRDLHLPAVERLVHRTVPAAALRLQRQLRGHVYPVLLAQHRVAHLAQRVRYFPRHRNNSPRNAASTPCACSPPCPSWTTSCGQAILKAAATASTIGFRQAEPTVSRWLPAVTATRQTTQAKLVTADSRG
jgi:hypothetical protein